jgi:hypothetical protein
MTAEAESPARDSGKRDALLNRRVLHNEITEVQRLAGGSILAFATTDRVFDHCRGAQTNVLFLRNKTLQDFIELRRFIKKHSMSGTRNNHVVCFYFLVQLFIGLLFSICCDK